MTSPHTYDLTTGSVAGHLTRLSIPMVWGILAIVSMQVMDVYFVAQLGQTHLEAISYTFPVSMTVFNLVMGLSIATSSIVSRLIGSKQIDAFRHFIAHAVMLAAATGAALAAIGVMLIDPIFNMLSAGPDHLALIRPFMQIQLWGYMFITIPLVVNAALRGSGDTVTPSLVMVMAAVVNIPLSYTFVFGFGSFDGWGMTGAAVANVTANATAAVAALYIMIAKRHLVTVQDFNLSGLLASAKRLFAIAAPIGVMNVMQPLTVAVITAWLATSGPAAVAAYGMIGRVEAVATIALMAVSVGMSPLMGQNFGARRFDRMNETMTLAIRFAVLWSVFTGLIFMLGAPIIAKIFTDDPATIAIFITYFWIMGITRAIPNVGVGWGSMWYAVGKPQYGVVNNVSFLGIGTLLCGGIGNMIAGWYGLFTGMMIGGMVVGLALHFWSQRQFNILIQPRLAD